MNTATTLCTSTDIFFPKTTSPSLISSLHLSQRPKSLIKLTNSIDPKHPQTQTQTQTLTPQPINSTTWRLFATPHQNSASDLSEEIDMVKNSEGIWSAKPKKVVVLWDLDNKPPRGPPYQAAMALKSVAQQFGDTVEISAYANRHAFVHLPQWVLEQRREQRRLNILERKGIATPSDPYICGVCGRKCRTNLDLQKHFKQLHERERQKKLSRMRSLKGKKRQRYKERFVSGNVKYEEAARSLLTPKVGYGLAAELRRAGVFVKTVEDKPQAADWAVKRQMQHSMSRGVDWMFLVSDDSDFSDMLKRARDTNLKTVVVGDWDRALGRHADLWFPWNGVENGEIGDEELMLNRRRSEDGFEDPNDGYEDALFSVSEFDEDSDYESDLDQVVDEIVVAKSGFSNTLSAFSEDEGVRGEVHNKPGDIRTGKVGSSLLDELFWDSEGEESDDEDGFI